MYVATYVVRITWLYKLAICTNINNNWLSVINNIIISYVVMYIANFCNLGLLNNPRVIAISVVQ